MKAADPAACTFTSPDVPKAGAAGNCQKICAELGVI
jgi:hypothetical protein